MLGIINSGLPTGAQVGPYGYLTPFFYYFHYFCFYFYNILTGGPTLRPDTVNSSIIACCLLIFPTPFEKQVAPCSLPG